MNSVYCAVGVSDATQLTAGAYRPRGCCVVASVEIGDLPDVVVWGEPEALRRLAAAVLKAAADADHLPELPDLGWPDCEDGR